MDIKSFDNTYSSFKQVDKITINCDHPSHVGDRTRTIGKGPARRNILKNNGQQFICRDCTMAFDNPANKTGQGRSNLGDISVHCPGCGKDRVMNGSCYYGPLIQPYEQVCGTCSQEGKIISEEAKEKISEALTGRKLSEEHRQRIAHYMRTSEEARKNTHRNLIPGEGAGWNKGLETPEDVRKKISEANKGRTRTEEHKANISAGRKKMLKETGGFSVVHRQRISKATVQQFARGFVPHTYHKRGHHNSPKAGIIFYRSSYEKKAFMILDETQEVASYQVEVVHIPYYHPLKNIESTFIVDLKIIYADGRETLVEVKPRKWLKALVNEKKIEAAKKWSAEAKIPFEVWDEYTLFGPVNTEKKAREFALWVESINTD